MAELEKVIKALEQCREGKPSCDGCPYDIKSAKCLFLLHSDALELLKEQQQIIRCKDCKYGEPWGVLIGCGTTKGFGITHNPDWFCADGERKPQK